MCEAPASFLEYQRNPLATIPFPMKPTRSILLFLVAVTTVLLFGTTPAEANNGVHTAANQTVNAPTSNEVPTTPVQRERTPFGQPVDDEQRRRQGHAVAARATLVRKREEEIARRVANGELESAVLASLEEVPSVEDILNMSDTSQAEILAMTAGDTDAMGRPLVTIPTPDEVRAAGYAPEAVDRVIQDAKDARERQISDANAQKAAKDAGEKGLEEGKAPAESGQGANRASAATFEARGEGVSSEEGQKAAADEKANSPAGQA